MKRYLLIFTLLFSLILNACASNQINEPKLVEDESINTEVQTEINNKVEEPKENLVKINNPSVVDGDTIKGVIEGEQVSIRLLLIDTPETKHPSKPEQPFGKEASNFTNDFITKNKDNLYIEYDVEKEDRYDRVLGYIWAEDEMLNALLVKNGLARVGYIYDSVKHLDLLKEFEKEAKSKRIGIWSIEGYVTDKGYNDKFSIQEEDRGNDYPSANANSQILDANGDGLCNDVKGNIGSNGKIYHIPGGQFYKKTKAEEYFCTEEEAVEAGYRKSQR